MLINCDDYFDSTSSVSVEQEYAIQLFSIPHSLNVDKSCLAILRFPGLPGNHNVLTLYYSILNASVFLNDKSFSSTMYKLFNLSSIQLPINVLFMSKNDQKFHLFKMSHIYLSWIGNYFTSI